MHDSPQDRQERRALLTRKITDQTGIDEAMIEQLVGAFYKRVRSDPLLAPIFAAKVSDWDAHNTKLCTFWSSVALMSGHYHGQPMQAHLNLPVDTSHFDRWLVLFEDTAVSLCPPAAAAHFMERARRIADSMELGIAAQRGEIKTPPRATAACVRQPEMMQNTNEPSTL
jgi:hemoglobin